MNSFLNLIEGLSPEDIGILFNAGNEEQVIAGKLILEEGHQADSLFVVLQGLLGIRSSALPGSAVATVGPGAIVGDIAFLTGGNVTADVRVIENSLLLKVPIAPLRKRMDEELGFGLRLCRALACLNAGRLVETTRKWNAEILRNRNTGSIESGPMADLLEIIVRFKAQISAIEKEVLKSQGVVREEVQEGVTRELGAFGDELNALLGSGCDIEQSIRDELGHRLHIEFLPMVLLTDITCRMYTKPRGYAGDYLTIQKIYEDEAGGSGHLGPLIDRAFLEQPAARAVRNRRGLMAGKIKEVFTPDREVQVTSFACGPARELFDAFDDLQQPENVRAHLVDIDVQALDFLRTTLQDHPLEGVTELIHANLVYLALGRQNLDLPPQDLIYSIGLIDYFGDRFVVKLLNFIHERLGAGGRVVLGNFHPDNPTRGVMDHVLDWKLIHRNEDDMNRLFRDSLFGCDCAELILEDSGVNLFAVGIKS